MILRPEQIKARIDRHDYNQQIYDLNGRLSEAIRNNLNHINVPYHLCDRLINELEEQGYYVRKKSNFFWGNETLVEWVR